MRKFTVYRLFFMYNHCKNLFITLIFLLFSQSSSAQYKLNLFSGADSLKVLQLQYGVISNPVKIKPTCTPFFCRQEENIFRKTGINIKFRVGDYDYTSWMENKPNSFLNKKY